MKNQGFTLIELLIVMAILGILAMVGLSNFRTSQLKARDTQRKADLKQIANALEAYMSDQGRYPVAGTGANAGKIMACADSAGSCTSASPTACQWSGDASREICDINNTVYMQLVPGDPLNTGNYTYCYESDGTYFRLFANFENTNDLDIFPWNRLCSGRSYNYRVSSGNIAP